MRAGSLSDPRVVAIINKYFVPVHVPLLCTAALIEDERDLAALKVWDAKMKKRSGGNGLWGGVCELMALPDGEPYAIFALLRCANGSWRDRDKVKHLAQYEKVGRENPKGAATYWFKYAAKCLKKVHGELPKDWQALTEGTAPEVRKLRGQTAPEIDRLDATGGLRITVRNSLALYKGLVGSENMHLSEKGMRELLPDRSEVGASKEWPQKMVMALLKRFAPRGQVHSELREASIEGSLTARNTRITKREIQGELRGSFRLNPTEKSEVSKRPNASHLFDSRAKLRGDYRVDRRTGQILQLRLISEDGSFKTFSPIGDLGLGPKSHRVAVEWVGRKPGK